MDWNSIFDGVVVGGVSVLLTFGTLDYCNRRMMKNQTLPPGKNGFSGSTTYRVFTLFILVFFSAVVTSVFLDNQFPKEDLIYLKIGFPLFCVPMVCYLIISAFFTKIFLTEEGILKQGIRRTQQIRWQDIVRVTFSGQSRCFVITSNDGSKMTVEILMAGIPYIVKTLRSRVSAEALAPAEEMLDYFEEK